MSPESGPGNYTLQVSMARKRRHDPVNFYSYDVRKCSNLALHLGILLCLDLKVVHVIKSEAEIYWFYKAGYVSPVLLRFPESFIPEG